MSRPNPPARPAANTDEVTARLESALDELEAVIARVRDRLADFKEPPADAR